MGGKKRQKLQLITLTIEYKDMFMIDLFISFFIGFALSSVIVMFLYKKLDVSYLLNTIKEDIANLQVSCSMILDKAKK